MAGDPETPLATYRENTAWRQQSVRLFADRVDVHRSISLADEADWRCSLVLLAPQFQTGRQRNPMFLVGLGLLAVWLTVLSVLWQLSSLQLDSPKAALFWAMPVLFVTMALSGVVKRPYVVVHSADGAPLFTIVKNWPDGKRFGTFTETLLARIRDAHSQVELAAEAPPSSTAPRAPAVN